jgi:ubiquinone/menaquinone biosynthesis C-methylase UbiE
MRRHTLASASGSVVEIGYGSGANVPYYPPAVNSVAGVEPNPGMTDRARVHGAVQGPPVRIVTGLAEALPFADASFDTAVSTLTLCSVEDPRRALAELHRVLRNGGALLVLEHGLASDPAVARWQQRLNGVQRVVACGCNLNRPMTLLLTEAAFTLDTITTWFVPGVPRPYGWITAGRAIRT